MGNPQICPQISGQIRPQICPQKAREHTSAKQLVLVKTNKEGWKQSIVLHIFGKLVKHSLFGSGYIVYDLARVATLNFRQIATVWTDKL